MNVEKRYEVLSTFLFPSAVTVILHVIHPHMSLVYITSRGVFRDSDDVGNGGNIKICSVQPSSSRDKVVDMIWHSSCRCTTNKWAGNVAVGL